MKYSEIFMMKTSWFFDSQILAILKQAENRVHIIELCRDDLPPKKMVRLKS